MRQLGADGIESVLLEGGAMLNWSALEAGIVNEVYAYVAPKLFGGADAKVRLQEWAWIIPMMRTIWSIRGYSRWGRTF